MARFARRPEPVSSGRGGLLDDQIRAFDERLSNVEALLRQVDHRLRTLEDHLYGRGRGAAPATRPDGMLLRLALVEGKMAPGQPKPSAMPVVRP